MSDVSISLDADAINQLLNSKDGPVAKQLIKKAMSAANAAKRLCPVDTGRLRASIVYALGEDEQSVFAAFGSNVEYALYVETGTRYMSAQPFLRPALTEEGNK